MAQQAVQKRKGEGFPGEGPSLPGDGGTGYRRLFEASPEAIFFLDEKGVILDCNRAAAEMTGRPRSSLVGERFAGAWGLEEAKSREYEEVFSRLLAGGEGRPLEHEIGSGPAAERRWVESLCSVVRAGGEILGIQVVGRDITDRKRTETELRQAYEELKRLDGMKDDFLSTISHELRTPLTSIRSFSEILLQYDDEPLETRREFLEIIRTESERLTRLINDFLDLSKIEAGRMAYNDDLLSVREVIEEAVRSQRELLRRKSIVLETEIAPSLPFVFADRDRIQQVVTNLLSNAVKFSHKGGRIVISAGRFAGKRSGDVSEWVKVSVSDEGIGIDEKDFEVIFDKFHQIQSDTLEEKPKGTGLGLPICKEIIAHYGGNIWVEGRLGEGSTFSFTLPAANMPAKVADEVEGGAAEEGVETEETAETGWKGKTILVVDDNANIRRLLRYQLQRRGYKILEASNGADVLEIARNHRIDLITLDLIMPVMNGFDILGMIREDPKTRGIPVLIISMVENREKGVLLGANDYLVKPFQTGDLIGKVRNLLGEEKRSILVVDDEPTVLETLRMQLEEKGYPVDVAYDGEEALRFLKTQPPDLVILDMVMPKMNGYEVLRWIRNHPHTRHLPVVVLSAYKLTEEGEGLLSMGIDAYVEKSEGLSALLEKIEATLDSPEDG